MAGESAERQYAQQRSRRLDRIKGSWPSIAATIGVAFAVGWIVPIIFMSAAMFMLESMASDERSLTVTFPRIAVSLFSGVGFAAGAARQLLGPSRAEAAWGSGAEGERVVARALDDLHSMTYGATAFGSFTIAEFPDHERTSITLPSRQPVSSPWMRSATQGSSRFGAAGPSCGSRVAIVRSCWSKAHRQAEVVRSLLQQSGFDGVVVTPALCFVNTEIPLLFAPKQAGGALLGKPRQLRRWLTSDSVPR